MKRCDNVVTKKFPTPPYGRQTHSEKFTAERKVELITHPRHPQLAKGMGTGPGGNRVKEEKEGRPLGPHLNARHPRRRKPYVPKSRGVERARWERGKRPRRPRTGKSRKRGRVRDARFRTRGVGVGPLLTGGTEGVLGFNPSRFAPLAPARRGREPVIAERASPWTNWETRIPRRPGGPGSPRPA